MVLLRSWVTDPRASEREREEERTRTIGSCASLVALSTRALGLMHLL